MLHFIRIVGEHDSHTVNHTNSPTLWLNGDLLHVFMLPPIPVLVPLPLPLPTLPVVPYTVRRQHQTRL